MNSYAELPIVVRARNHRNRLALIDPNGRYTYSDLLTRSHRIAAALLNGEGDLHENRVAFLLPPAMPYVATQWAIWRAGGIAVPLSPHHTQHELQYAIEDSDASVVITTEEYLPKLQAVTASRRMINVPEALESEPESLPFVDISRRAMILYTSGTTSRPKGVVTTHGNIQAQVESLIKAWEWSAADRILNVLPLHHLHGIINVVTCALWAGAVCEMLPQFEAEKVRECFESGEITLFMAVPTIYAKLLSAWEQATPEQRQRKSEACANMRLMVSGSAALPVQLLEKWKTATGHVLLERYGMTECGMILSNPLHGERRPGFVGMPLPGVEVRLVEEDGSDAGPGAPGEILVKGPGVFEEYWRRPEATQNTFRGEWFSTGDIAVLENGSYRILGRKSIDIIKTGGYKVSALEIEEVLRQHHDIRECAVVGVEDSEWGEYVCAAIVWKEGKEVAPEALRQWAKAFLAPYKVPAKIVRVAELPRNSMGKVVKTEVKRLVQCALKP